MFIVAFVKRIDSKDLCEQSNNNGISLEIAVDHTVQTFWGVNAVNTFWSGCFFFHGDNNVLHYSNVWSSVRK